MSMSLLSSHESVEQRSSLTHFYIPSTEQASSWCSVVFVELIDWFMASPLGPPPSGHCKCENSWVILGLQSNDLSWSCKGSLLKDLRKILHATYARFRCRQKRILLISFHNRLMKLRLPVMFPTGSLPGSIRTLALLCMALKESSCTVLSFHDYLLSRSAHSPLECMCHFSTICGDQRKMI